MLRNGLENDHNRQKRRLLSEELTFKLYSETDVEETFVVTWEKGSGSYITDGVTLLKHFSRRIQE